MAIVVHVIGLTIAGLGYLLTRSGSPVFVSNANVQSCLIIAATVLALILSCVSIGYGMQDGLPFFAFLGGLIGLLIIMGTVYSIEKQGVLIAIAIIMVFEIVTASLIDHHGLFSREKSPMNFLRIVSLVLMVVGILIGLRSK